MYRRSDGLSGVVIANNDYPERVAHTLISKLLLEFEKIYKNKWKSVNKDETYVFSNMSSMLKEYQNPEKADKLLKLQNNLDSVKDIMHKNIEQVLRRGEKLDDLLDKSQDIGELSKMFHNKAKKNNQCCTWY